MATSSRSLDLDIVTLRRIYIRNSTSNALIQSNYALLSDGKGGTYWSTVVTGSNSGGGGGGISGDQISSFSTSIGTSFTTQSLFASNITATNITTGSIYSPVYEFGSYTGSNFRLPSLACCNIFLDQAFTQAPSYAKLVQSNLN